MSDLLEKLKTDKPLLNKEKLMDKPTLKALKASIKAWELKLSQVKRVQLDLVLTGGFACPLCQHCAVCSLCPVKSCLTSPYGGAVLAIASYRAAVYNCWPRQGVRNAALKAVRAEVEFLKALLPVEQGEQL